MFILYAMKEVDKLLSRTVIFGQRLIQGNVSYKLIYNGSKFKTCLNYINKPTPLFEHRSSYSILLPHQ